MRLEEVIIALVIVSLFIVGSATIMVNVMEGYDKTAVLEEGLAYFENAEDADDNSSRYNLLDDMKAISGSEGAEGKLLGGTGVGEDSKEDDLFKSGFSIIPLFKNIWNIMYGVISGIATALKIPTWMVGGIMTIFMIMILFTIVYLIFRHNPR